MVEQIFDDNSKRLLRALFVNARQRFIGAPAAVPGAGPFVNITDALRTNVRNQLVGRIVGILAGQGIVVPAGTPLHDGIVDFAERARVNVEEEAMKYRKEAMAGGDKRAHDVKRAYQIGDTADPPGGYTGTHAPQWMRKGYKPFKLLSEKTGHTIKNVFFSLILLVVGIAISTAIGNMWFMVGFMFLFFNVILPDPEGIELAENPGVLFGSYLSGDNRDMERANRTNTGVAFLKAITKVGIVICFIGGLYTQPFPTSNLILLFLAFGFYFSMHIEFDPTKPYEFIESFFRVLLGVFIAVFVFGAFGAGIFQSRELGWMTLAFFVVFPVAKEQKSLIRALGRIGSGTGESYEMLDKIIFLVIMLIFAFSFGFGFVGGFFSGTGGIIFSAVWVLGLVAGLTTPAETRPWMGVIILIVGFLVFGLGTGQQAMGVAFFGEWWPTVHNSVTEFMEPIGDMFTQFQNTFGQTWLLFTSPTEFAKQITQGTYAQNELGITGAYGMEIRKFDVQSIYIDEPFVIQVDLENKGIFHAKNVKVDILTNIKGFKIGTNAESVLFPMTPLPEKDKYEKQWYKFTFDETFVRSSGLTYNLDDIERQDALSIFLIGKMTCEDFKDSAWSDFGILGGHEHTVREMFIPFVVNVTYEYESESSLQVDFISTEEWSRLSKENKLLRFTKPSIISVAPASLNLGTMDQPIKEDSPFFVGFNLTTTWPQKTMITRAEVNIAIPKDFGAPASWTKRASLINPDPEGNFNYTFNLTGVPSKSGFLSYNKLQNPIKVPKKTYTISASSIYTFSKWEDKDTQFNFKDVCWPRDEAVTALTRPGGTNYCNQKIVDGQGECEFGMGGCLNNNECGIDLECRPVGSPVTVCCYQETSVDDCKAAYENWIAGQ